MTERWLIYQRQRFPLARTTLLVGTFCLAVLSFAHDGSAGWIPVLPAAGAAASALLLFLQLRIADEFKDAEDDARYRPERPVPSGLVSLRELAVLAWIAAAVQFAVAIAIDAGLVVLLAAVWAYAGLMTREFFVPSWLRRHPVIYLSSHMLVMPLITFYVSAFGWLARGQGVPDGIGWLLALSFCVGTVLELGRKILAPGDERPGVETYSALWGPRRALAAWGLSVAAAAGTYAMAVQQVDAATWIPLIALPLAGFWYGWPVLLRRAVPSAFGGRVETASGVVALCLYAGLLPLPGGV